MKFNLIVACAKHMGIGFNNSLPWHLPQDLKRFSRLTRGGGNNAIIMGRKTWESLPKKFLPKRDNLILSRNTLISETTETNNLIQSFQNIENIIRFCKNKNYDEIWVIGGEQIYKAFANTGMVTEMYITQIHKQYNCDAFFPLDEYFKTNNYKIINSEFTKEVLDGKETMIEYITYKQELTDCKEAYMGRSEL